MCSMATLGEKKNTKGQRLSGYIKKKNVAIKISKRRKKKQRGTMEVYVRTSIQINNKKKVRNAHRMLSQEVECEMHKLCNWDRGP